MSESSPAAWAHRQCLCIGGVSLGIMAASADDLHLTRDHQAFRMGPSSCDIEISIERVEQLTELSGPKLFDSGSVWTLYKSNSGFVFDFTTPVLGPGPYKRLWVNEEFSQARLCVDRNRLPDQTEAHPLEYPVDELLVTNWLALGRGVEVHSCGFVDPESGGQLFIGHSGAGKSTTTRLWSSLGNVRILSDDRIILRRSEGQIWMHGTPWHGEAGFASPEKAAIRRIFVIEHGTKNEITRLSQTQAVAELFARSFVPFHSRRALDFTLSYLQDITSEIPCYRFQFLPDSNAVRAIRHFYE